jgi:hypothetical protein
MNRYSQHLGYTLLALLLGLPAGCALAGILLGVYGLATEPGYLGQFPNAFGFGFYVAFIALFIGILPSFIYGAPVYALLSHRNIANIASSIAVGAAPGLIALPFEPSLAAFLLVFGTCVAMATHLIAKRRLAKLMDLGANNSFKPTPLRGVGKAS